MNDKVRGLVTKVLKATTGNARVTNKDRAAAYVVLLATTVRDAGMDIEDTLKAVRAVYEKTS